METKRRNKRSETEWKMGMKMKVWKNKLLTDEGERETLKSSPYSVLDRPWGFQEIDAPRFQDSRHSKFVSTTYRPSLPPTNFSLLISVSGWVDPRAIVRPEGLCQCKIPMKLPRIEPATLRFVTPCPNQMRHCKRQYSDEFKRVLPVKANEQGLFRTRGARS